MQEWPLIEADLQEIGVDVGSFEVRRCRSWRWGEAKILGLLTKPPVGYVQAASDDGKHTQNHALFGTRIQTRFLGSAS